VGEEEDRQACEEEERRKLGRRWADVEGDELMAVKDDTTDTLSEFGSKDDLNDPKDSSTLARILSVRYPHLFPTLT
jgi:hypothetical protein